MTAYEIFNLLVKDLRNLEVLVSDEIKETGESNDLLLMKEYIEKTRVEYNRLYLPTPFRSISTSNSKQFIVALTEFLISIRAIAFGIFNERINARTREVFSRMESIYEFYINLLIEQLE